jgi:hypothetical protein
MERIRAVHKALIEHEEETRARVIDNLQAFDNGAKQVGVGRTSEEGSGVTSGEKCKTGSLLGRQGRTVSYETQLGIHLFFKMLEFLSKEECDTEVSEGTVEREGGKGPKR